ncbi:MAG: DNA mismatch repair endonuclease MutL [Clostridia bacterium]|nr:DNA mismatch repair endonuclease MutL [Clostridia bacterium]
MANLIAAGEVVERPASAAKELIENSIDAGATRITVEIKDGGISLLRVTDDGCGIASDEAETAFQRYATSKISKEEDLFGIGTMGFRGEALAAIAAVSKTTMLTSTGEGEGRAVSVEGGTVIENTEAGCPKGTTIAVRELFYNTPARHKFLKKDSSEAAAVQSVCTKAAIAHPHIAFRLSRDGETVLSTPGDGDLFAAVYCIYGREFASGLLKVDYTLDETRVSGYVCRPDAARKNRSLQMFFVNTRPVKSLMMQSALEEAFRQRMVSGRYPVCFLNVELPLSAVDVNVHPTKTEVKFAAERRIFETIYYGVKSGLAALDGAPAFGAEPDKTETQEKTPAVSEKQPAVVSAEVPSPERQTKIEFVRPSEIYSPAEAPKKSFSAPFTARPVAVVEYEKPEEKEPPAAEPAKEAVIPEPVRTSPGVVSVMGRTYGRRTEASGVLRESSAFARDEEEKAEEQIHKNDNISNTDCDIIEPSDQENFRIVGELFNVYIVVQKGETLLLVDKHAAHERIRYNALLAGNEPSSQGFLDAPVVVLNADDKNVILDNSDLAAEAGFEVEDFGGTSILLRSVPTEYVGAEPADALTELAACLKSGVRSVAERRDRLMKMVACKTAVKSGDKSDIRELEAIVRRVMTDPAVRTCPHGRPVAVAMTKTEIEKRFSRIV